VVAAAALTFKAYDVTGTRRPASHQLARELRHDIEASGGGRM